MIAAWMSFGVATGILFTLAAIATERGARAARLPARFVWLAAIGATVLWPAIALWTASRRDAGAAQAAVSSLPFAAAVQQATRVLADAQAPANAARIVDGILVAAWVVASVMLFLHLAFGWRGLARQRAAWRATTVDGVPIRVSADVGPAVVGLRPSEVVVPEWALALDEPLRALVLRHEREHGEAGDPRLLFASATLIALMPWNLALWWQARRLRLAVEVDCDARVLHAHPNAERYGMLLLTIAQRRAGAMPVSSPSLSEPTSHLERRIIAMRAASPRFPWLHTAAFGLVAIGAIAGACALQSPDRATGPLTAPSKSVKAEPADPNRQYFEFQVEKPVQVMRGMTPPHYPDALRSALIEGQVVAAYVVDTTGRPVMSTFKVIKSSNEEFTTAVRDALVTYRFTPAEIGGRKVKQLVQQPFLFSLSGTKQSMTTRVQTPGPQGPANPRVDVLHLPPVVSARQTDSSRRYVEFQIEKPAQVIPGMAPARYPDALRSARIEGEVVASFVVDTTGLVDMSTFKVLKSTNSEFTTAVRDALVNYRYSPAEVGGRKVRQLLQQPFQFSLSPNDAPAIPRVIRRDSLPQPTRGGAP